MAAAREFEVIVWGATGFTGQLVAEYFQQTEERRRIRIALAGRNRAKLDAVRKRIGGDVKIVTASLSDPKSLREMCRRTEVLLSTVGPFLKHGTPVVEACIQEGTGYVDTTGETPWVRSLIDRFDAEAKAKGVAIVPMCGFDSIPSDLGVFLTCREIQQRHACNTRRVETFVAMRGKQSGGTLATGIMMERDHAAAMKDVFLLGGERKTGVRGEDRDVKEVSFNKLLGKWTAPFLMAKLNTRVVRRSNLLFERRNQGYGELFSYQEKALAPSEKVAKKLLRASQVPPEVLEALVKAGRLPKQGQGPSKEERAKSWFKFFIVGQGENGCRVMTKIRGGDAGYEETAKMVSEAAILLASSKSEILRSSGGGILTPAFAFGDKLVARLKEAGISFGTNEMPSRSTAEMGKMSKL